MLEPTRGFDAFVPTKRIVGFEDENVDSSTSLWQCKVVLTFELRDHINESS